MPKGFSRRAFVYRGEVRGKQRPRITFRGEKPHAYTPKATKEFEEGIRQAYLQRHHRKEPIDADVPLRLRVVAYVPESKVLSRPDVDNILKAVMDALSGVAYADDKQIVSATVEKVVGKEERLEISLGAASVGREV